MENLIEVEEGCLKEAFTFDVNLQRGPRYRAYSEMRERKIRKRMIDQTQDNGDIEFGSSKKQLLLSPPPPQQQQRRMMIKEINNNSSPVVNRRSSLVGQSVPNFSAVLRKENRKPVFEMRTPPPSSKSKDYSKFGLSGGGSKSASGADKRGGGVMMARKSYANIEDLKTVSSPPIKRGGGGGGAKVVAGGGVHTNNNRTILGTSRLYLP
ncbi:uncharacterized protein LOC113286527 [Papaver somniferum]|uniref:uncharacterized protein LOC113286527 n=1 Tax=Papaver somniferum TaxID=3469 RepID=UPI000E70329D|nr:uncharacterized protein LOC113286527 [Papaver somniferum]